MERLEGEGEGSGGVSGDLLSGELPKPLYENVVLTDSAAFLSTSLLLSLLLGFCV